MYITDDRLFDLIYSLRQNGNESSIKKLIRPLEEQTVCNKPQDFQMTANQNIWLSVIGEPPCSLLIKDSVCGDSTEELRERVMVHVNKGCKISATVHPGSTLIIWEESLL